MPTLSIADAADLLKVRVEEAARLGPGARHAIVAAERSADARREKAARLAAFHDAAAPR